MNLKISNFLLTITLSTKYLEVFQRYLRRRALLLITALLSIIAAASFLIYLQNGLGLAYNDARSHLDIGRRVVEGLKPGLAQLGSVWLPLPHLLMIPTVWNDFMWHSGLSGALQSMIAFVATGLIIYLFLKNIKVGLLGRFFAVLIFTSNLNILYLQSTAMTELLILAAMMAGAYYLMLWHKDDNLLYLIKSAFFIMLSTVTRYDGWFLLFIATILVVVNVWRKQGYKATEGTVILFTALGALGIVLWFLWNLLIFNDPLYFAFGPFSAHAQQSQIYEAGDLLTKGNLPLSIKIYTYALIYNSYAFNALFGLFGALLLWSDRKLKPAVRLSTLALVTPLLFNVLALYLGHSVLFIQGQITGNTWFNVRYGMMFMPAIAIFSGFLVDRIKNLRWVIIGLFSLFTFFAFASSDAVTIDDALVGSSQKNVTEVSGWLNENAADEEGFVLISAASHDAVIFSSGLPMKRFIHEGTGEYWESATTAPDRWARWIVMRTHDTNDLTFKLVSNSPGFEKFELVDHYPFADIYQLKPEYLSRLHTEPVL